MKSTFLPFACTVSQAFCSAGVSSMQGGHHEPQTLTTSTVPARSALLHGLPSRVVPASFTGSPRSVEGSCSMEPSPAT